MTIEVTDPVADRANWENRLMFIPGFTTDKDLSRIGLNVLIWGSVRRAGRDLRGASGPAERWAGSKHQRLNRLGSALLPGHTLRQLCFDTFWVLN